LAFCSIFVLARWPCYAACFLPSFIASSARATSYIQSIVRPVLQLRILRNHCPSQVLSNRRLRSSRPLGMQAVTCFSRLPVMSVFRVAFHQHLGATVRTFKACLRSMAQGRAVLFTAYRTFEPCHTSFRCRSQGRETRFLGLHSCGKSARVNLYQGTSLPGLLMSA
jgi:hypothetical protein